MTRARLAAEFRSSLRKTADESPSVDIVPARLMRGDFERMLYVVDAMKASAGFVRPMREGEQLLRSGMVISVGKKGREDDVVHVHGLVLRTSGLGSKDPALVELWINTSKECGERLIKDNEDDFRKHCDCPAGNSEKCKHIMAVMLALASLDEEELEDLTCTDVEQQWGTLKRSTLREFESKPLSDLCHVKGQKDAYVSTMPQVTKEMEEKWRKKLMNSAPLSEISIFSSCLRRGQGLACSEEDAASQDVEKKLLLEKLLTFRSWHALGTIRELTMKKLSTLEPELIDFYNSQVATTLDKSLEILCAEQGSPGWHHARKFRITASKARAQYTYYVNKNPNWDNRYKEVFHSTFEGNEHTLRGLVDEKDCREKYEERFSCSVLESGLLVRPEVPWLSCSVDGTRTDQSRNLMRNLEVKSFKEGTRLTANELLEMNAIPTLDTNGNVKKNTQHYAQMQIGMLLSGMNECDYLSWSGVSQDFVCITVTFDENHVVDLCSRLINVYFEEFLPRIMREYAVSGSSEHECEEDL